MNDTKAVSTPSADETEHCRSRVLQTTRSSISCVSLKSDWSKFDPPLFSDKCPEDLTAALQTRADLRVLDHTCLKSHDSGEDVEDVEDVEEEEVGEEEDQRLMKLSLKLGSCGNLESYQRKLKSSLKQSYEPQMSRPYVKQQVYQAEDTSKESTFEVTEGFKTRPDQSNSKDSPNDNTEVFRTRRGRSTFKGSPKDIVEVFSSRPGLSPPHFILTLGVAGAGKSSLVHSVVLDWCEDRCLQDVHLLVPLTFSRLNQLRNQSCSLLQLMWSFCPGLKESRLTDVSQLRILFILDGLDECRLPLDFTPHAPPKADLHTLMPVPTLLVSLLEGALLPEAQVWVTSRPPAASLPASLVHSATELHGFSPRQQEELSDSQQKELSDSQQQEEELSDSQQQQELSDSQQQEELSDSQQQQDELSDSQQQQEEELSHSQQEEELSHSQQQKELSDSQQQEELSDSQQQQEEELSDSQQEEELSHSQQQEELSDSQQQGLSCLPLIHSITARLSKERGSRPTQTQTLVHLLSYLMMKMQHSYSLTQSRVHEIVLSLSTLASQLKGPDSQHNREGLGQHTFCEEDLKQFGVSRFEALVWSGLCVEVDSGRSGPCCCECGRKAPLYEFVDESLRRFLSTLSSRLSQDKGPNSSKKLLLCLREMDQEETRRSTDLTLTSPWPQRVTALSSWNYKNL